MTKTAPYIHTFCPNFNALTVPGLFKVVKVSIVKFSKLLKLNVHYGNYGSVVISEIRSISALHRNPFPFRSQEEKGKESGGAVFKKRKEREKGHLQNLQRRILFAKRLIVSVLTQLITSAPGVADVQGGGKFRRPFLWRVFILLILSFLFSHTKEEHYREKELQNTTLQKGYSLKQYPSYL